jgi:hypothetical protein
MLIRVRFVGVSGGHGFRVRSLAEGFIKESGYQQGRSLSRLLR